MIRIIIIATVLGIVTLHLFPYTSLHISKLCSLLEYVMGLGVLLASCVLKVVLFCNNCTVASKC